MEELNLSTCRKCNLIKVRIQDGKFDEKNKRFVDENGKLWSGKYCPPCNQERIKEKMQALRDKRKAQKKEVVQQEEPEKTTFLNKLGFK